MNNDAGLDDRLQIVHFASRAATTRRRFSEKRKRSSLHEPTRYLYRVNIPYGESAHCCSDHTAVNSKFTCGTLPANLAVHLCEALASCTMFDAERKLV